MTTKVGGLSVPFTQRRAHATSSVDRGQQRQAPPGWQNASTFEARRPSMSPDANRDGVLDDSELAKMAEHISSRTGKSITAADLKAKLDGDGDGSVTSDELRKAMPHRRLGFADMPSPDIELDAEKAQMKEELTSRLQAVRLRR